MACEEMIVVGNLSTSFTTKEDVFRLMDEKERIETAIKDLWDILKTNNIGMGEPLVDMEDYPRSDIDVYEVRHARHRINCLQNDHMAILKKIEDGLACVHKDARLASRDPNGSPDTSSYDHLSPIVKVDQIHATSPASIDGLRRNDLIYKFGPATSDNFVHVNDIGKIVQESVKDNKEVEVIVKRDNFCRILLKPRLWHGVGYLGCHIIHIVPSDLPDR